jgi:hypothetical protein
VSAVRGVVSGRWLVCGAVLLVADVLAPRRSVAFVVDLHHRYVGHEAVRGSTVPVILAGLEEHVVA